MLVDSGRHIQYLTVLCAEDATACHQPLQGGERLVGFALIGRSLSIRLLADLLYLE